MIAPADMTIADMRLALAPHIAAEAAFDGWSAVAAENAARSLGIAAATAHIVFPGGAMDMIEAWVETIDAAMESEFAAEGLLALPVRERIRRLVQFRLDAVEAQRESLRRALAIMAMPRNVARTARIGWRSADRMWRLAGDTASDYNHYTKRAILAGIYAATLSVFVGDKSENCAETAAFLDRRIAGIIRFEKAKARWSAGNDMHFSPARFLGRLRYPAR